MWTGTRPICCEKIKLDSIAIDEELAANRAAWSTVSSSTSFCFFSMEYEMEILKIGDQICPNLHKTSWAQSSSQACIWMQSVIFSSFPVFLLVTVELAFVNLFSTRSNSSSFFNFWRKPFFQVLHMLYIVLWSSVFFPGEMFQILDLSK